MATGRRKIFVMLVLAVVARCDDESMKDDLAESESKDPTKVEIIKQIKRVNEDGSYTFGYEAEDGTFKIESRDVLGNVKGTFGFVDADGEIKRVSYSSTASNNETTSVTTTEKEKSSVIQHIPRTNRTATMTSSTRKPLAFVSTTPASTSVVQSIPRRRILASSSNSSSTTTTSTTAKPSYKNIVKATDFDISTITTSTAETPRAQQAKPAGHYIRSTFAPLSDGHRLTEGQLIRPTQPATVTTHPLELYPRRIIATRHPYLEDRLATIKPISQEGVTDTPRANLLRRQLNQEKVFEARQLRQHSDKDNHHQILQLQQPGHVNANGRLLQVEEIPEGTKIINFSGIPRRLGESPQLVNFDAREHMLHLQQSIGEDSTDVYSASVTTGTPRPLFTTTERPFPYTLANQGTRIISPINYSNFQKSVKQHGQETTTDSTNLDNNYAQPVLQVAAGENGGIPLVRARHPFHGGAILIPVNQAAVGGFVVDDPNEDINQANYGHFTAIPEQQYLREASVRRAQPVGPKLVPVPYLLPKRRPIPLDYQPLQANQRYLAKGVPITGPANPLKLQDEIDNIKPPVSTRDFQKLLNRLILRQSQLQEISRLEQVQMLQKAHDLYGPASPTPVSVFVRARPNAKPNHGPVQFVEQSTNTRNGHFISVPQPQPVPIQKLLEDRQPDYESSYPYTSESYARYRSGRRAARLNPVASNPNENESYLPPDVREMLLLRMLQLAINPNLPLPPSEADEMSSAIRHSHKEAIRNVQILGEETDDENKPTTRNKRFPESSEFQY